jgi:hypothetical protein
MKIEIKYMVLIICEKKLAKHFMEISVDGKHFWEN